MLFGEKTYVWELFAFPSFMILAISGTRSLKNIGSLGFWRTGHGTSPKRKILLNDSLFAFYEKAIVGRFRRWPPVTQASL